jgi:putative tryptophan/tyrosine transport system substrate-binding protein
LRNPITGIAGCCARAARGQATTAPPGLVRSLARPEGNTTGVSILASELDVKRLEVLHEYVPLARRIAVLVDPTTISTRVQLSNAARDLGVELLMSEADSADEIGRALDAIARAKVEALNVLASPLLFTYRHVIIERAAALRLPAIYQWPETAEEGGLLAYGPRFVQIFREMLARQLVRLLRGTRPADLPVEQPSKFELAVNLKTAKALGLDMAPSLLARADEVIE